MDSLVRWEPFSSLRPWFPRDLMDDFFDQESSSRGGMNVYEDEENVVIEAAVPGIPSEDVEVTVEGDLITISGEVREEQEEEEKDRKYYRRMASRTFYYTTTSPRPIQAEEAEAEVEDGVVTVTIPKAEEAKPKKITVKKASK